ncbi:hypothetical protein [Kitasatospora sp. NPDC091207]|uniref:hypothetical protein n=1 Tax=Kitasatospora sp. NPDC091207 TaxID=3364083 RepID=UPI0037F3BB73
MTDDDGRMSIDLAPDTKGWCTGSMGMPGAGTFEIVNDGKQSYVKPDKEFWTAIGGPDGAKAAELFKGRYLAGFESDPEMKNLSSVCNLAELSKKIVEEDGAKSTATEGSAGTVNGAKTFSLKVKDEKGEESTIHVATEGRPYPVRIEKTAGKDTGRMDFTDYDKPLTVQAPPADSVLDFSKFKDQFKTA